MESSTHKINPRFSNVKSSGNAEVALTDRGYSKERGQCTEFFNDMTAKEYLAMRKTMGLSQKKLAHLLGYKHPSSVLYIEHGRWNNEDGKVLARHRLALEALKYRQDCGEIF